MRDIPIIYSGPMVRAMIREAEHPGTGKTMTRRMAWGKEFLHNPLPMHGCKPEWRHSRTDGFNDFFQRPSPWQKVKPGDRLWVRENWSHVPVKPHGNMGAIYAADGEDAEENVADTWEFMGKWTPSIHMPRWASRLTLIVTATKIERLQEISEADAKAEGALFHDGCGIGHSGWRHDPDHGYVFSSAAGSFANLWARLHGAGSWDANPEVVCLSFVPHKTNIDQMRDAA